MNTTDAVQKHICDTDTGNEGAGSYTADDITPQFAAECLERGEFADGTPIDDTQRAVLEAVRDGRETTTRYMIVGRDGSEDSIIAAGNPEDVNRFDTYESALEALRELAHPACFDCSAEDGVDMSILEVPPNQ